MSLYFMTCPCLELINVSAYYELNKLTQSLRLTVQCLKVLRVRTGFRHGITCLRWVGVQGAAPIVLTAGSCVVSICLVIMKYPQLGYRLTIPCSLVGMYQSYEQDTDVLMGRWQLLSTRLNDVITISRFVYM